MSDLARFNPSGVGSYLPALVKTLVLKLTSFVHGSAAAWE